jgi:hypothetical protein
MFPFFSSIDENTRLTTYSLDTRQTRGRAASALPAALGKLSLGQADTVTSAGRRALEIPLKIDRIRPDFVVGRVVVFRNQNL